MIRRCIVTLLVGAWMAWAQAALAADSWVEVKSPNFTVLSNAGEGRTRNVAWQFEQIRAALLAGWPWARARLDRPVYVIAAKDEATMKALAPKYWEERGTIRPASVFVTAPDRHYIALRGDVRGDGQVDVNPYFSSYWSYSAMALDAAFDTPLPLWFRNGLAGVLANAIVRDDELRFGLSVPSYHSSLVNEGRLRLPELLTMTVSSPYYTSGSTRGQFDAQSWGLVHYMLFARAEDRVDRVNAVAKLLLGGRPSVAALEEVYGSMRTLEVDYIQYLKKPIFPYSRLKAETRIVAKDFAARSIGDPEALAARAGFHVAMNRPVDARALIAEGRKTAMPAVAGFEAEAMLLDREGKRDDALAAFLKAEELRSENFFVHYRLATLTFPATPTAESLAPLETRLRRAVELNDAYSASLGLLANILVTRNQAEAALVFAKRAATLEPGDAPARAAFARALWAGGQRPEAMGHARAALSLAQDDAQRRQVQELIDFFTRSAAAPAPR
jgi:tetratricopeptide (TPR) repeat protein